MQRQQRAAVCWVVFSLCCAVSASVLADPVASETSRKPATEEHPANAEHPALKAMQSAAQRAKRDQARKKRYDELQVKLRGRDVPTPMRTELRNHARRVSRLQRIRELANGDVVLVARVDGLLAREGARHERRMKNLFARAAQTPAPTHSEDDEREPVDEVEE